MMYLTERIKSVELVLNGIRLCSCAVSIYFVIKLFIMHLKNRIDKFELYIHYKIVRL